MSSKLHVRDFSRGFFSDPRTDEAIVALAKAPRLTLFLGAGVSSDLDVPTWETLVKRLLHQCLIRAADADLIPLGSSSPAELADRFVDTNFQLPVATTIDDLFRKLDGRNYLTARNDAIRNLLYHTESGELRTFLTKPSLARRTLELAATLKGLNPDRDIHIITTNYDDSLSEICVDEGAFDMGVKFRFFAGVGNGASVSRIGKNVVPVIHVHGRITRSARSSGVVFSEPDYVNWISENRWRRDHLRNRLGSGSTLMIGTSLRDHNIINYLARTDDSRAHRYALLPLQGDDYFRRKNSDGALPGIEESPVIASLQEGRGSQLGIRLIRPDFFGQVLQFVSEIKSAATDVAYSTRRQRYPHRVQGWWQEFRDQKYMNEALRRQLTEDLQELSGELKAVIPDAQHVKIEVWTRAHFEVGKNPDILELWCSSQVIWPSLGNHWPRQLSLDLVSTAPVVLTFANQAVTHGRSEAGPDGRWTHYMGVPIVLDEAPHNSIPVGTVMLYAHAPDYRGVEYLDGITKNKVTISEKLREFGAASLGISKIQDEQE